MMKEPHFNHDQVGRLLEDDRYALLERKEKRIVLFIIVFFTIGVIISFGAWVYYLTSMLETHGEPIEDPNETIESIQLRNDTFRVLAIIGSSFVTTSFILVFWWAYLRHKRSAPLI
jgi:uncharacterized BrkB/YihY/UPF0761 family membrane protein